MTWACASGEARAKSSSFTSTKTNQANWQPISQMPLIASMISASLNDTREHLGTLSKAKDRPHVLDDATLNRVEQVHTEQMDYVEIYAQQIGRWRNERPSAAQARELDRMDNQNRQLRSGYHRGCPGPGRRTAQRHHRACIGDERHRTRPPIPPR